MISERERKKKGRKRNRGRKRRERERKRETYIHTYILVRISDWLSPIWASIGDQNHSLCMCPDHLVYGTHSQPTEPHGQGWTYNFKLTSPFGGHLGCFQSFAISKNAMNNLVTYVGYFPNVYVYL